MKFKLQYLVHEVREVVVEADGLAEATKRACAALDLLHVDYDSVEFLEHVDE